MGNIVQLPGYRPGILSEPMLQWKPNTAQINSETLRQTILNNSLGFNLSNHASSQRIGQAVDAYRAVCAWLRRRLCQLIVDSLYVEIAMHRVQEVSILEQRIA